MDKCGARQAGIYVALSNLWQRLEADLTIDVYGTARLLAQQRVGIFSEQVHCPQGHTRPIPSHPIPQPAN